jgi:YjbE family integral membrane protein
MEFLSAPWWSALLTIILIDLVLAGDNAIVIALAARSLPKEHQRKAIVWGTVGAIVVRSVMTVGVVWLLKIPGLMLVGGLALLWIAYRLIAENDGDEDEHGPAATTFWGAMKTIVIADAIMGIDNVLGVAGAAHGAFDLVVLGLLISIPIVVFGSTLVLKLVERFPAIMYIGAAVLAFTAGKMIVNEKLAAHIFKSPAPELAANAWYWAVVLLSIVGVLGLPVPWRAGAEFFVGADRGLRDRPVQHDPAPHPGGAHAAGDRGHPRPVPVCDQRPDVLGRRQHDGRVCRQRVLGRAAGIADLLGTDAGGGRRAEIGAVALSSCRFLRRWHLTLPWSPRAAVPPRRAAGCPRSPVQSGPQRAVPPAIPARP